MELRGWNLEFLDVAWSLEVGSWNLDFGVRTLEFWNLDSAGWSLENGIRSLGFRI